MTDLDTNNNTTTNEKEYVKIDSSEKHVPDHVNVRMYTFAGKTISVTQDGSVVTLKHEADEVVLPFDFATLFHDHLVWITHVDKKLPDPEGRWSKMMKKIKRDPLRISEVCKLPLTEIDKFMKDIREGNPIKGHEVVVHSLVNMSGVIGELLIIEDDRYLIDSTGDMYVFSEFELTPIYSMFPVEKVVDFIERKVKFTDGTYGIIDNVNDVIVPMDPEVEAK